MGLAGKCLAAVALPICVIALYLSKAPVQAAPVSPVDFQPVPAAAAVTVAPIKVIFVLLSFCLQDKVSLVPVHLILSSVYPMAFGNL